MAKSRAHERGLERARAKRQSERRRRRKRIVYVASIAAVATVVAAVLVYVFVLRDTADTDVAVDAPPTAGADDEPAAAGTVACEGEVPPAAQEPKPTFTQPPTADIDVAGEYTATLSTSCGDIHIELFAQRSPRTVDNFVALAETDYYAGVTFHRVIDGFVVQAGDPTGTGSGDPGYTIEGELSAAEELGYERGIVAMANRGNDPSTASTQFFIVQGDASQLPPRYAVFGRVIDGMDVVDAVAAVPTDPGDTPTQTVYIEDIEIEGP